MEWSRYAAYDSFAWFYNRYWGARWVKQIWPVLEKTVLSRISPQSHILDLCCGTGHLAAELVNKGFKVTGLDGSEEMLAFARENAPAADFILGDARKFDLGHKVEMVISTYDSLNHIMSCEELTSVFVSVQRVMKPGGFFLFDLNMHEGYMTNWKRGFPFIGEDHLLAAQPSYDAETKIAKLQVVMFRRLKGNWVRSDVVLEQRCYSENEVCSALSSAGFTHLNVHPATEFGWPNAGRYFFVAS